MDSAFCACTTTFKHNVCTTTCVHVISFIGMIILVVLHHVTTRRNSPIPLQAQQEVQRLRQQVAELQARCKQLSAAADQEGSRRASAAAAAAAPLRRHTTDSSSRWSQGSSTNAYLAGGPRSKYPVRSGPPVYSRDASRGCVVLQLHRLARLQDSSMRVIPLKAVLVEPPSCSTSAYATRPCCTQTCNRLLVSFGCPPTRTHCFKCGGCLQVLSRWQPHADARLQQTMGKR